MPQVQTLLLYSGHHKNHCKKEGNLSEIPELFQICLPLSWKVNIFRYLLAPHLQKQFPFRSPRLAELRFAVERRMQNLVEGRSFSNWNETDTQGRTLKAKQTQNTANNRSFFLLCFYFTFPRLHLLKRRLTRQYIEIFLLKQLLSLLPLVWNFKTYILRVWMFGEISVLVFSSPGKPIITCN